MKIIITAIFLFGLSIIPALAHAAPHLYYVTQNGMGTKDGKSLSNAWSVSDFNSSANWSKTEHMNKINPGDTVYFSGEITSKIKPPVGFGGSDGNYITLDGWKGGNCNPVADGNCPSAAVIDRPSRAKGGFTNYCMSLTDNSYLIIQDFNMKDSRGGIGATGPSKGDQASHLIIRRNYIHNMSGHGVQITGSVNYIGYDYVTFGGALGDGNLVYDTVEDSKSTYTDSHCFGLENANDVIISYNVFDNSFQDLSDDTNTVSLHTGDRILFEYNTVGNPSGQACVAVKEHGGNQKIVRFNKCYGCGAPGGINVVTGQAPQTNYYIYGNLVYDSSGGIILWRNYDEIHVWSNIIHNISAEFWGGKTHDGGQGITVGGGGIPGDVYVYNNTISRCDMKGDRTASSGLNIVSDQAGQNVRVKNNIFYYNSANVSNRQIYVNKGDENNLTALEHNTYFTSGTPYIYYFGSSRNISTIQKTNAFENGFPSGNFADPGFVDPAGADDIHGTVDDNYKLNGTVINNGADLSKCFKVAVQENLYTICYNDAIDPRYTDWTRNPPKVRMTKQENYGSWERGAYVYTGKGLTSSALPDAPRSLRIIAD